MSIRKMKKHDYAALLRYMQMLDNGYSFRYISTTFGIDSSRLKVIRAKYHQEGVTALQRKKNIKADFALKKKIVLDIEKNHLTLHAASLKYDASTKRIEAWLKIYRQEGMDGLVRVKNEADRQVWVDQERTASLLQSWKDSRRRTKNSRQRLRC